jgi:predicted metal-dependent enzyme (double-stranded beta helix superfamily)
MSTLVPTSVGTDRLALARRWANPDLWPGAPRFDPARRWYHRLQATADHEVWLLTWLPGQGTELHDHGASGGAFVVVSGEISELSVEDGRLQLRRLTEGSGREFAADHIHRIVNVSDSPAVSVHVYGPALSTMTRYQLVDGRITVVGIDRAGVQW